MAREVWECLQRSVSVCMCLEVITDVWEWSQMAGRAPNAFELLRCLGVVRDDWEWSEMVGVATDMQMTGSTRRCL